MGYSIKKQMTCYQVQRLMDLYIGNDPSLTVEKRKAFDAHLHNCQECARKHEESQWIVGLVRVSWPYEEKNQAFLKRINQPDQRKEVIEQCWQELKCRIPELTPLEKKRKYLPLFQRIGAFAACLIIGISVFLAFSYLKPKITQEPAAERVVSTPKPSLKVELVSENGNMPLPYSHQIIVAKELKNLIINSKHRMVMNPKTSLSIEPLVENSQIGCKVTLGQGEIYINVEHDGKPFVVATAHGKAVITGTTFHVRATDTTTTLVVAEGTVQFESTKGAVEVAAGQTSEIVTNSSPTKPISCNTAKLTAWATAPKSQKRLSQIKPALETYGIIDLSLFVTVEPIDLKSVNYEEWVEQKRGWFKQQFPWIFQLQSALTKEGVKADYPELLISSGDIWQFAHLETSPQQIPILYFDPLLKTVSTCGFDKRWLLENVPAAKLAINRPTALEGRFTGLEAFGEWVGCIGKMRKSSDAPDLDTLLCSLHASTYLVNTRTLAWLSMSNDCDLVDPDTKADILVLLQTQVDAANNLNGKIIQILWMNQGGSCGKCDGLADEVMEGISTIVSVEERLLEHEPRR